MGSYVGPRTIINVTRSVRIGEDRMISWDCDIRDTSWHRIRYLDREPKPVSEPIVIQDHVWIGSHTIIEKGVTIGRNSMIGSCSKVIRDIPANSLAAGNPATVLTEIEGWDQNPDFPDARYDNRKDNGLERT